MGLRQALRLDRLQVEERQGLDLVQQRHSGRWLPGLHRRFLPWCPAHSCRYHFGSPVYPDVVRPALQVQDALRQLSKAGAILFPVCKRTLLPAIWKQTSAHVHTIHSAQRQKNTAAAWKKKKKKKKK